MSEVEEPMNENNEEEPKKGEEEQNEEPKKMEEDGEEKKEIHPKDIPERRFWSEIWITNVTRRL